VVRLGPGGAAPARLLRPGVQQVVAPCPAQKVLEHPDAFLLLLLLPPLLLLLMGRRWLGGPPGEELQEGGRRRLQQCQTTMNMTAYINYTS
jgi:hypothetical protein